MGLFDSLFDAAKNAAANAARSAGRNLQNDAQGAVKQAVQNAADPGKTVKVTLSALPEGVENMAEMPEAALTDPAAAAALTVAALCAYAKDRSAGAAMLNFLRGPRPMSPMDENFIRDRFMDGKDYIPRSYFDGAKPENDYTPALPYTVSVKEQSNSREQEGYITLYLFSGGGDNPRPVTFRNKPSTGQWFLWEYAALLSGIRIPKSQDAWA